MYRASRFANALCMKVCLYEHRRAPHLRLARHGRPRPRHRACARQGHGSGATTSAATTMWANIDIVKLICQRLDRAFAEDAGLARRFPSAPSRHRAKAPPAASPTSRTAPATTAGMHRRAHDHARARLCAAGKLRDRHPQDHTLVPGQRGLVAGGDGRQLSALDRAAVCLSEMIIETAAIVDRF